MPWMSRESASRIELTAEREATIRCTRFLWRLDSEGTRERGSLGRGRKKRWLTTVATAADSGPASRTGGFSPSSNTLRRTADETASPTRAPTPGRIQRAIDEVGSRFQSASIAHQPTSAGPAMAT